MAATLTTGFLIPAAATAVPNASVCANRRRCITPRAGRALETLAHAIEYLTDEFVHQSLAYSAKNEQLEAVRLLMALNRQVYFELRPSMLYLPRLCCAQLHLKNCAATRPMR